MQKFIQSIPAMGSVLLGALALFMPAVRADEQSQTPLPTVPDPLIVGERSHDTGGRRIIVQEVTADAFPTESKPLQSTTLRNATPSPERATNAPAATLLHLSALRSSNGDEPVLYQLSNADGSHSVAFWSAMEPECVASLHSLPQSNGQPSCGVVFLGATLVDRTAENGGWPAGSGSPPPLASIGKGCLVTERAPSEDERTLLAALHSEYALQEPALRAVAAARAEAQRQREAERAANPPLAQDVIIRFRRLSPEERK